MLASRANAGAVLNAARFVVDALDRYVDGLSRVKLTFALRVEPISVRLVWRTEDFSGGADRPAIGEYVCPFGPKEIARRADLPLSQTGDALEALVDAGHLELLRGPGDGYRLRVEREQNSAPIRSAAPK